MCHIGNDSTHHDVLVTSFRLFADRRDDVAF